MRIACILALLCVGFAHEPPGAGAQPLAPRLPAHHAFPDGTPPVLCLSGEDDGNASRGHAFAAGCEACRLAADVAAPLPAHAAARPLARRATGMAPARIDTPGRHVFPPGSAPRAPPPAAAA